MVKLKCYIYGAGAEYNRLASYLWAYKEMIEILGIVTTQKQKFDVLDSIPCIRPQEIQVEQMDYIIIAVEDWREIYNYLKEIKIKDTQILRSSIFYVPKFDLDDYLEIRNTNVSILANTCLGGMIYKELGLKTLSPTIGARCTNFLDFLDNYSDYLKMDMEEFNNSNFDPVLTAERYTPKGIIDNKIVWYFPHAEKVKDAVSKWNIKRKEVNFNNIVAIMLIEDEKEAKRFEELPIKKKMGIYSRDLGLKSVICCPGWENEELRCQHGYRWTHYVHRCFTNMSGVSRIDWIKFLIGKEDFLRY